jgi:hypothetical protein
MGLFDSLRDVVGNLEAQARQGDEGAKAALGLGAAFKGTLENLGEAAQQSAVDMAASRQRQAVDRATADAVGGVCAALGLSTDGAGNLTLASKRKVFKVLVDAIEFYQDHDFRFFRPIHIGSATFSDGRAVFTIGNLNIGGGKQDVSARNAGLFRDFLDSLSIRYRERTARNIFELAKGSAGSTYVFEVRPERDVPGRWHELCQIDIKQAVPKLLTMLTELR